jgi:hypothetical protein
MTRTNGQHGEAMPSPSSCRELDVDAVAGTEQHGVGKEQVG